MRHRRRLLIILTLAVALATASFIFVYSGFYNVSALEQHTPPVYQLLQFSMVRSVAVRSERSAPELGDRERQQRGLVLYEAHCRQCHGAPGMAPEDFSLGMVPAPTAIAAIARRRAAAEIFWVVKHGIKMTGMPAWEYRLTQEEIWDVVAFVKQVAHLTVDEYIDWRRQVASSSVAQPMPGSVASDSAGSRREAVDRGRVALQQYNCISCHTIPGITAARNHVGPPLGGITRRAFIAGVLDYSDANLVRWIRFPRGIDPQTLMPELGVSETDARAMAAYFHTVDGTD